LHDALPICALPPAQDQPRIAGLDPPADDPSCRLSRLLHPVRWLLLAAVGLVAADALATVAMPSLFRVGVDDGVVAGSLTVVLVVAGFGALIALANWAVIAAQPVVTVRAGESGRHRPRVREYAHADR